MPDQPDVLYYSPGSASFAVHWLLIELDRPHLLERVDTAAGQQRSPEYLALNPNGRVPTLVIDGASQHEAAALLITLADADPAHRFAPQPGDPDRALFLQWMFNLANEVQPLLRQWWYPGEVAGEAHAEAVRATVERRLQAAWERIDAALAQRGPYLLGASISAADLYLTMLLRWSRQTARQGIDWPRLRALAELTTSRPAFAEVYAREGLTEWP